jgi:CheY-like chemotaxis protein
MGSDEGGPRSGGARYEVMRTAFRPGFGGPAPADRTALVVENDYGSRTAMTALLERVRLTVVAAESGHSALDVLAERDDIAVVLIDIMMPIMDGYETMRAVRKLPRYAELPIIAVTAKDGIGERERCLEAGASGFITKPVDTAELLATIGACTAPGGPPPTTDW